MRKLAAVLLLGSVLAVSTAASAQGTTGSKSTGKQDLISRADTDGDGKVSRDEFLTYERTKMEKMFDKMDTNKDGYIEKSELGGKRPRHNRR